MTDPNEDKMPLTAHLEELRKRLVRSLIAVGIAFLACFFFKEELFGIVARPLIGVLPPGSHLIYTGLPEAFFTYIKVSFYAGLFVASPVVLYQVWKFISPGLYPGERKFVAPFVRPRRCCSWAGSRSATSWCFPRPTSSSLTSARTFSSPCFPCGSTSH